METEALQAKLKQNPPFHAWYLLFPVDVNPMFKNCYFWAVARLSSVYSAAVVEI